MPHLIVVLNATDLEIDEAQWDPHKATHSLLTSVGQDLEKIPELKSHLDTWRRKGRSINSTSDLLYCYYSSITILRVPAKGRYILMNDQVRKLHTEISERARESQIAKRKVRMLANSDDLQLYLRFAFNHFARYEKVPLNFIELALRINPIPSGLQGNMLKLAIAIMEGNSSFVVRNIFQYLSIVVASCIMRDIHQRGRLDELPSRFTGNG